MSSNELILDVPYDIIESGKGLSLDLGALEIAVIYLPRDKWLEQPNRKGNTHGQLHLVKFPSGCLDQALDFLSQQCHVIRTSPSEMVDIYTTGVTHAQKDEIASKLNVRCINMRETECYAKSCLYILRNLNRRDALVDLHMPVYDMIGKKRARYLETMSQYEDSSGISWQPDSVEELSEHAWYTGDRTKPALQDEGAFPCLVFMCGRQSKCIVINEDSSFVVHNGSIMGDRMFLGVASLLTNGKSYSEVMSLAKQGNPFTVGLSNTGLGEGLDVDEDNLYTSFMQDEETQVMAYFFGRAVGKSLEDFSEADVVRCLLDMVIQQMVHVAHQQAKFSHVKNVFFCGDFTGFPCVRELLTREWLERDVILAMFSSLSKEQTACHFLKHGSYLGAIGAYLSSDSTCAP